MTSVPTPDETAARLDAAGEAEAAALIRAMTAELQKVREEREAAASFTRSIAGLAGYGTSRNAGLVVRALETLDALRVTERCPRRETGRHRWMRADPVFGSRCMSCHARRPDPQRTICWCGREVLPGEDHSLCYPVMD